MFIQVHLSKIEKRIKEYEITEKSEPRAGKNLLVLDIDYTLFDHRSVAETGAELMRPYLHEFLTSAYEVSVDLIICSTILNVYVDRIEYYSKKLWSQFVTNHLKVVAMWLWHILLKLWRPDSF